MSRTLISILAAVTFPAIANAEVVQTSTKVDAKAQEWFTVRSLCKNNEKASGGGFSAPVASPPIFSLKSSYPEVVAGEATGWVVEMVNVTANPQSIEVNVFAICRP